MASLHEAIAGIANKFNVKALNRFQMDAITKFVDGEEDIFINLPTGYGKSLIYQFLPLVYDAILKSPGHIVAVVSPLINLIAD
jgi:superfamily II DNA helicase RecQ